MQSAEMDFGADEERMSRCSPGSLIKAVFGVVAAAFVLSLVYGPCEHYSPLVYLNLILALLLGYCVGEAGRYLLRRFRIRRRSAAFIVGLAGGVSAVFFAWVSYVWVISDYDFTVFGELVAEPFLLGNVIQYLAENPLWAMKSASNSSQPTSPLFYYAVWILECVVVLFLSVKGCLDFTAGNILCGECGEWLRETGDAVYFPIPEEGESQLCTLLQTGDVTRLAALERIGEEDLDAADGWLEVKAYDCLQCTHQDAYVRVMEVKMKRVKKKEPERNTRLLLDFCKVGKEVEALLFGQEAVVSGKV